jgi:predicted  nucleic acid-binding Zn-ribbon protein
MRRERKEKGEEKLTCSAIANQESLSILEVEMRKLEAVTKEIVDELGYLQRREMRMRDTNGESFFVLLHSSSFQAPSPFTYHL